MDLLGVNSNYWAVFFVHASDLEGVLAAAYYIVIEFIPRISYFINSRQINLRMTYQNVKAASLGPGNLDTGLRYRRYIAPAIRYNATAVKPTVAYG